MLSTVYLEEEHLLLCLSLCRAKEEHLLLCLSLCRAILKLLKINKFIKITYFKKIIKKFFFIQIYKV